MPTNFDSSSPQLPSEAVTDPYHFEKAEIIYDIVVLILNYVGSGGFMF